MSDTEIMISEEGYTSWFHLSDCIGSRVQKDAGPSTDFRLYNFTAMIFNSWANATKMLLR